MARSMACVVLGAIVAGCSAPSTPSALSYEEFKAHAYRDPETGVYVINGDEPAFSEAELQSAYRAYRDSMSQSSSGEATVQQGLIVNLFNGNADRWDFDTAAALTYCVSQSSFGGSYNTVVNALASATQTWHLAANVNFVHVTSADANCTNSTAGVVFNVREVNQNQFLARSFFPSTVRSDREVLVDTTALDPPAPYSLAGIFRHELGHTLGFRHEHTRPESGACFEDNQWQALTAYDSASVMHYPQCNGTNTGDLVLTQLDLNGVHILYPRLLGKSVLWHYVDGGTAIWNFNEGPRYPGSLGTDWSIQGAGDFNGDGSSDVLWRNANGQVQIWFMSGETNVAQAFPGGQDPAHTWAIQTTGDFNGDGRSDILWRDTSGQLAIWFEGDINDAAYPGYSNTPYPVPLSWQVQGTGDFDGDGHADILWRDNTGQVGIWFMNGGIRIGEGYPGGPDPSGTWFIQGVGDFDGDGKSDILWRNTSGQVAIWFMNGGVLAGQAFPGGTDPSGIWSIQGVGDFNANGQSDILWRNTNGMVAIWIMNGGTISEELFPGAAGGGSGWTISGVGSFN